MLTETLLSAIGGFMAKACDEQSEHGSPHPKILFFIAAIAYGAALGWLSISSPLASLFLALAAASILAGKIDHMLHALGLAVFALVLLTRPLGGFDAWIFSLFLVAGLFDELNLRFGKVFVFLGEQRLFVPLCALGLMLYSGQYIFLLAIIAFDLAYRLAGWMMTRKNGTRPGLGVMRPEFVALTPAKKTNAKTTARRKR